MKTLSTILAIALFFLFSPSVKADHVMGSDIRWECLGNDSFKITVTAYRDCNGSDLSAGTIYLISQCSGATTSISSTKSSGEDITPTCDTGCTRCSDANCTDTRFGIQRYEITGYVKIDRAKCCKWKIAWGQCCRSSAITTGAAGENFYNEAFMDICIDSCNNSPYFSNPPRMVFCKDKCVTYYPGVRDIDTVAGKPDSLVFKFSKPLEAAGAAIPYSSGYDYDEPLNYFGDPSNNADWEPNCQGFHLNPFTGILNFKPIKEEESVIVIVTEEWRDDSLGVPRKISETRRDLQVAVVSCDDNKGPTISAQQYAYTFCTNRPNCFTFNTFDLDKADTVSISAITGSMPGSVFYSESGKKWPKGTFCWTPTDADVRSFPYNLLVEVQDNACPDPNYGIKTFAIYVKRSTSASMQIKKLDDCGTYAFSAAPDSNQTVAKYSWMGEGPLGDTVISHDSAFTYRYSRAGTYKMNLTVTSADGCNTIYTDSVVIPPVFKVELPHHNVSCTTKYTIPAQVYDGVPPYTYTWSTGDTVSTLEDILVDRDTFFIVTVTDGKGCTVSDSMHVAIMTGNGPTGKIQVEPLGCRTFRFSAMPDSSHLIAGYLWEGQTGAGNPPIYTTDSSFIYTYSDSDDEIFELSLTMITPSGCKTTYKTVPPLFKVELPDDTMICRRNFSMSSQVSLGKAPYKYEWSTGDTGVSALNGIYVDRDTFFIVTVTDSNGCTARDSMHVGIIPGSGPTGRVLIDRTGCHAFKFTAVADSSSDVVKYLWTGDVPFGDRPIWTTAKSFIYTYSDTGEYEIRLTMTSASGCKTTYTEKVWSYHPHVSFTIDSLGAGTYKFIPNDTGYSYYRWYIGDSSFSEDISPTHTFTASGQYDVVLYVIDSVACASIDTQTVSVWITSLADTREQLWKIYPNPINGNKLVVESPAPLQGEVDIILFDAKGRRVVEVNNVKEQKTVLELPGSMQPGTYIIKIQGDDLYTTEVLVK